MAERNTVVRSSQRIHTWSFSGCCASAASGPASRPKARLTMRVTPLNLIAASLGGLSPPPWTRDIASIPLTGGEAEWPKTDRPVRAPNQISPTTIPGKPLPWGGDSWENSGESWLLALEGTISEIFQSRPTSGGVLMKLIRRLSGEVLARYRGPCVLSRLAVGFLAFLVAGCATTSSSLYEASKGGAVCHAKPLGAGTRLHYVSKLEKRLAPPPGFTAPFGANDTEHSTLALTVLSRGNGLAMTLRMDSDKGPSARVILSPSGVIHRVEPLDTEQERKSAEFILRILLTPLVASVGLARPGDQVPYRVEVFGVSVRGTSRLEKLAELEGRPVAEIIEDGFQEQAEAKWQMNGFAALWRNYRSHARVTCDRKLGFLIKYRGETIVDTTSLSEVQPGPFTALGLGKPYTASGRQETVQEIDLDWRASRIFDE